MIITQKELIKKVTEILVDKLAVEPSEVVMEANLEDDLFADSINCLEIFLEAEKVFNINIKDAESVNVNTVQDFVDLVEKKLS